MSNRPSRRRIRVTYDVDRAAIAQQVVKLRAIREFVDPGQIDEQQPTHVLGRSVEAIEVHRFEAMVGPHTYDVPLVADDVDQLELLE
jgi:hypothetical protein